MGAYNNLDQALAGLMYGVDHDIESPIAMEAIDFGLPLFGYQNYPQRAYKGHQDRAIGTFAGVLITANSVAVTIIVNGETINIDPVVFATDSPTTIALIIAAINANARVVANGLTAVLGSTALKINLTGMGQNITSFTAVVTAGSTQTTFSAAYDTWARFLGVAGFTQRGGRSFGAGTSKYNAGDAVNCVRRGQLWVPVSVAVQDKEAAYAIYVATNNSLFTDASSGNYDIGCYFRSNRNAQNLALLEVRGLK